MLKKKATVEGTKKGKDPLVGKPGTTYAGGDNPRNRITGQDDYSQPPQNIADYGGYVHDKEYDRLGLKGPNGTLSPLSTIANNRLIQFSSLVVDMYNNGKTDPFTGAPVSKLTYEAALNIISAFRAIESKKK